jgi:UDP-N-acetylmuramate--alanine ligase
MDISRYSHIFLLGIGGIGMSALARYFRFMAKSVAGYDRTPTVLTGELEQEGIVVFYRNDHELINKDFKNAGQTLIVYTPAIKQEDPLLQYFTNHDFTIRKRADILGLITSFYKTIAIAGTHGKTTISTMTAHLLKQSAVGCTALLGGISKNYNTNFLFSEKSQWAVTEADEYDRSFLKLHPWSAVITSVDPDHLDIYGEASELKRSFEDFATQVNVKGRILVKKGLSLNLSKSETGEIFTYSLDDTSADVYAKNIKISAVQMEFDVVVCGDVITWLKMKPTGLMNIENAVAAIFMAKEAGVSIEEIRKGLASFEGVRRRFDVRFNNGCMVYIDDYAHHPAEIKALINSVKSVFPDKKITGVFQPHLYSRTRDFASDFAESLQALDEVVITAIYPAREEPIEGISANTIFEKIEHRNKRLMAKEDVPDYFASRDFEALLTIGAGDIDTIVDQLEKIIIKKSSKQRKL